MTGVSERLYATPVRAGRLRFRVDIETPDDTPDGVGGVIRNYTTLYTLWADIQTLSPNTSADEQAWRQRGERYQQYYVVTIRTQPGITNNDRINFKGRYFFIYSIVDYDVRRRMTQLYCREGG